MQSKTSNNTLAKRSIGQAPLEEYCRLIRASLCADVLMCRYPIDSSHACMTGLLRTTILLLLPIQTESWPIVAGSRNRCRCDIRSADLLQLRRLQPGRPGRRPDDGEAVANARADKGLTTGWIMPRSGVAS